MGEVLGQDLPGAGIGLADALAADQGVRGREGRGIGRVLEESPFAVEAPDVEGQTGGAEQHRDAEGEDDEDLATGRLAVARRPAPRRPRHQLTTIVTSPVSVMRPLLSLGRNSGMIGTMRSW